MGWADLLVDHLNTRQSLEIPELTVFSRSLQNSSWTGKGETEVALGNLAVSHELTQNGAGSVKGQARPAPSNPGLTGPGQLPVTNVENSIKISVSKLDELLAAST